MGSGDLNSGLCLCTANHSAYSAEPPQCPLLTDGQNCRRWSSVDHGKDLSTTRSPQIHTSCSEYKPDTRPGGQMLSTFSWSLQAATRTLAHAQSPPSTLGMYTVVLKPCVFQGTRWMRTPPDADGGCYYNHTSFAVLVVFMVPSR